MSAPFRSDRETGELLINNHTDSNVGSYTCEVKNAVGRAQCRYALHAYERESDNGAAVKLLACRNVSAYLLKYLLKRLKLAC